MCTVNKGPVEPLERWRACVIEDLALQTVASLRTKKEDTQRLIKWISQERETREIKLLTLLEKETASQVKISGAFILGEVSRGKALPLLFEYLRSDDQQLARSAYDALGAITGHNFAERISTSSFAANIDEIQRWLTKNHSFVKQCDAIWTGDRWESCMPLPEGFHYEKTRCNGSPPLPQLKEPPALRARCGNSRHQPEGEVLQKKMIAKFKRSRGKKQEAQERARRVDKIVETTSRAAFFDKPCKPLWNFLEGVVFDEMEPEAVRERAAKLMLGTGRPALTLIAKALESTAWKPKEIGGWLVLLYPSRNTAEIRPLIPKLLHRLKCDPNPRVQNNAARALSRFCFQPDGRANLVAALEKSSVAPALMYIATALTDEAICAPLPLPQAKHYAKHANPTVRSTFLHHLWKRDPHQSIAEVIEALEDSALIVKEVAVRAMASKTGQKLAPGKALALAKRGIKEKEVLLALITGIRDGHLQEGVPWLLSLLAKGSPKVRAFAVNALASFPERFKEILPRLQALKSDRTAVRVTITDSFGRNEETVLSIGDQAQTSIETLKEERQVHLARERLKDKKCIASCACLTSNYQIAGIDDLDLLLKGTEQCPSYFLDMCHHVRLMRPVDLARYKKALRSSKWYVQLCAVKALDHAHSREAREALRSALPRLDKEAKLAALETMATDPSDEANLLLARTMDASDVKIQTEAAAGLLARKEKRGFNRLLGLFERADSSLERAWAATGFHFCFYEHCARKIADLLQKETDWYVRAQLARSLHQASKRTQIKLKIPYVGSPDRFIYDRWMAKHSQKLLQNRDFLLRSALAITSQDDLAIVSGSKILCSVHRSQLKDLLEELEMGNAFRDLVLKEIKCPENK